MTYSMYRERDGAGDSGLMSLALYKDALGVTQIEENATPRVGVAMRVGSHYARTYSAQDWWQTTYIQEILSEEESETEHKIVFRTNNSVHTWTKCK